MLDERSNPFDEHIDAVARQITAARPRGDITTRVLARIAPAHRARPIGVAWKMPLTAAAVLTAIIVIAAGLYVRRVPAPVSPVAMRNQPYRDRVYKEPASGRAARTYARVVPTRRRKHIRVDRSTAATETATIATLQIDPLAVVPLAESPVDVPRNGSPEAIAIAGLTMTALPAEGEK